MRNKGASGMYGIILGLILALLVLVISIVFYEAVFDTGDNREVCAQSVLLRATLPENVIDCADEINFFDFVSFKDEYPLRCETKVVEIDKADIKSKDMRSAQKKIAEAMSECWYLYGKGDYSVFPGECFKFSTCVPCARIHLTQEAKSELNGRNISIQDSLNLNMKEGFTYYNYLQNSGESFSAFSFGNTIDFKLDGDKFEIGGNYKEEFSDSFKDKLMEREVKVRISEDSSRLEVIFEGWILDTILSVDQLSLVNMDNSIRESIFGLDKLLFDNGVLKDFDSEEGNSNSCEGMSYDRQCFVSEKYFGGLSSVDFEMQKGKRSNDWVVFIKSKVPYVESKDLVFGEIPSGELVNRINKESVELQFVTKDVTLPANFIPESGDLIINYGAITIDGDKFGKYVPYLFYFQSGQEDPSPFSEVKEGFVFNPAQSIWNRWAVDKPGKDLGMNVGDPYDSEDGVYVNSYSGLSFCSTWDGIPA